MIGKHMESLILSDRLQKLKDEVQRLRLIVASLQQEKSELELSVIPALRVEYMEKIGSLINRIRHQEIMVRELKFRIALVQAALNREESVSEEEVNEKVDNEYKEYEERIKEEQKKAEEEKAEQEDTERKRSENEARYNVRMERENQAESENKQIGSDDDQPGIGSEDKSGSQEQKSGKNIKEDEFAGMDIRQKVKELYRRIVKRLHPDINPNITEREKELWNMAQRAYKEWDVETLEKIYDEINEADVDDLPDTEESLEKLEELIERLEKRRQELIAEIERIKSEFPYTEKDLLENEEAVAKIQDELNAKIEEHEEIIKMLCERLSELNDRMQKAG